MREADAFEGAAFLGLSRHGKRDPYRLGLFARHFEPSERAHVLLAIQGGTLIVTDRRILEFRAHLEVHGAWNVKEFQGYEIHRSLDRGSVRDVAHRVSPAGAGQAASAEEALLVTLPGSVETFIVSRGPAPTLPPEDFEVLRAALLDHAK